MNMGDYFTPPPGYPQVPPEPSTPAPDFTSIGTGLWAGVEKAAGSGGILSSLFDTLVRWFTWLLGWMLSIAIRVVAKVFNVLGDITGDASVSYGVLVQSVLKDLFGVDVDAADVSTRRAGPNRQAVATKLGQTIINTMFAGVQADPAGGVVPSSAAADSFLSVVMNMELNGWVESWFADAVSYHLLEKWGDLKDGISRTMGLGRLSRQVFAAPLQVLVHEPYLALLHQKYRSKAPPEQAVINAFFRGEIPESKVSELLGNQGYTEQEIAWLVADHQKPLPIADIDYLLQRQVWTDNDAEQYLQGLGYTLADSHRIVAMLDDKRTFKYRQEMVSVAEAAYIRGDLDLTTFQQIVATLNLSQEETTWISNVATLKRSVAVRHLDLGQIETGIKEGVLSFGDLQQWAVRVNMPADQVAWLELILQVQINKQTATQAAKNAAAAAKATAAQARLTAAQAKAAAAKAAAADKGVSVAQAETLVEDGLWTFDQWAGFLTSRQYGPDAIASLTELLHAKLDAKTAAATKATGVRAAATAKGLSVAEAEQAVVDGILPMSDLESLLTAHGFDAADTQVLVELTQHKLDAANVKAAAVAAAKAKAAQKQLPLADVERAVRAGLTTIDTYNAALAKAGFAEVDIALLDGLLNVQITKDKATAAKQTAAAGTRTSHGITLSQLEQEVIQGIRPIADYTAELATLGYTIADQTDLTALVQLRTDQAKATAAHRAAATPALQLRELSIGQAETAVKLGALSITDYRKLLVEAGFDASAVDVLVNSLLAEVAKTAKTQAAASGASAALATRGLSLTDLERAVIAGDQPILTYTEALVRAGYTPAAVTDLAELLQLKIDHAATVAKSHSDAIGAATVRGIDLAKEEAAVIAGEVTNAQYDAYLTSLGFDAVDRSILEKQLAVRVAAAKAKAQAAVVP